MKKNEIKNSLWRQVIFLNNSIQLGGFHREVANSGLCLGCITPYNKAPARFCPESSCL